MIADIKFVFHIVESIESSAINFADNFGWRWWSTSISWTILKLIHTHFFENYFITRRALNFRTSLRLLSLEIRWRSIGNAGKLGTLNFLFESVKCKFQISDTGKQKKV